ncbi:BamA/TamA family outer membrane protein [candidate division KSB1 bacterium]
MKKLILYILIQLSVVNFSYSQDMEIGKISVIGNSLLKNKEVIDIIKIQENISIESIKQGLIDIITYYFNKGYLDVKLVCEYSKNDNDLSIKIDEGERFKLQVSKGEILNNIEFFDSDDINSLIDNEINNLNKTGYPFAKILIDDLSFNTGIISISLSADKGEKILIDTLIVRGAENTDKDLIIREARLKQGMIYDNEKLNNAEIYLNKTRFLEVKSINNLIRLKNGKYGLILDVTERKGNRFDGVIGYMPQRDPGEKGYFVGEFDLSLVNIAGTGRSFNIRWYKPQKNNQEIFLAYIEPWVFGLPINARFNFHQFYYDSLYTKRNFGLELNTRFNEKIEGNIQIGTESVIPGVNNHSVQKYSGIMISGGFTYDNFDNLFNPTRGVYYSNSMFYLSRKSPAGITNSRITDKKLTVNFEAVKSVFSKSVLYMKLYGSKITSSAGNIPLSQMYLLGGASSLRGYREEQFRTPYLAYSNLEYRYILDRYSRIYLFFDHGYFKLNNRFTQKSGFGFGFRIRSKIGIIGFDFAFSPDVSFNESKIHFRLINDF